MFTQLDSSEHWYELSASEILAIMPAAIGLIAAIAGGEFLLPLLALPGFLLLTLLKLLLRFGSLHGNQWDILAAPISAIITLATMRLWHKIRLKRRVSTSA